MLCPRCEFEEITRIYQRSQEPSWDIQQCQQCFYMWRSTEPARNSDPKHYPTEFKMTLEEVLSSPEVPAIPRLRQ